ncbi:MAG: hypothetical protein MJ252_08300, partial [archaeon]|nr:hypothetical protein [archaeon]
MKKYNFKPVGIKGSKLIQKQTKRVNATPINYTPDIKYYPQNSQKDLDNIPLKKDENLIPIRESIDNFHSLNEDDMHILRQVEIGNDKDEIIVSNMNEIIIDGSREIVRHEITSTKLKEDNPEINKKNKETYDKNNFNLGNIQSNTNGNINITGIENIGMATCSKVPDDDSKSYIKEILDICDQDGLITKSEFNELEVPSFIGQNTNSNTNIKRNINTPGDNNHHFFPELFREELTQNQMQNINETPIKPLKDPNDTSGKFNQTENQNKKLNTKDLIEITNRRRRMVDSKTSVDPYLRRRHMEELAKIQKIKKDQECSFMPKINKNSKKICDKMVKKNLENFGENKGNIKNISNNKNEIPINVKNTENKKEFKICHDNINFKLDEDAYNKLDPPQKMVELISDANQMDINQIQKETFSFKNTSNNIQKENNSTEDTHDDKLNELMQKAKEIDDNMFLKKFLKKNNDKRNKSPIGNLSSNSNDKPISSTNRSANLIKNQYLDNIYSPKNKTPSEPMINNKSAYDDLNKGMDKNYYLTNLLSASIPGIPNINQQPEIKENPPEEKVSQIEEDQSNIPVESRLFYSTEDVENERKMKEQEALKKGELINIREGVDPSKRKLNLKEIKKEAKEKEVVNYATIDLDQSEDEERESNTNFYVPEDKPKITKKTNQNKMQNLEYVNINVNQLYPPLPLESELGDEYLSQHSEDLKSTNKSKKSKMKESSDSNNLFKLTDDKSPFELAKDRDKVTENINQIRNTLNSSANDYVNYGSNLNPPKNGQPIEDLSSIIRLSLNTEKNEFQIQDANSNEFKQTEPNDKNNFGIDESSQSIVENLLNKNLINTKQTFTENESKDDSNIIHYDINANIKQNESKEIKMGFSHNNYGTNNSNNYGSNNTNNTFSTNNYGSNNTNGNFSVNLSKLTNFVDLNSEIRNSNASQESKPSSNLPSVGNISKKGFTPKTNYFGNIINNKSNDGKISNNTNNIPKPPNKTNKEKTENSQIIKKLNERNQKGNLEDKEKQGNLLEIENNQNIKFIHNGTFKTNKPSKFNENNFVIENQNINIKVENTKKVKENKDTNVKKENNEDNIYNFKNYNKNFTEGNDTENRLRDILNQKEEDEEDVAKAQISLSDGEEGNGEEGNEEEGNEELPSRSENIYFQDMPEKERPKTPNEQIFLSKNLMGNMSPIIENKLEVDIDDLMIPKYMFTKVDLNKNNTSGKVQQKKVNELSEVKRKLSKSFMENKEEEKKENTKNSRKIITKPSKGTGQVISNNPSTKTSKKNLDLLQNKKKYIQKGKDMKHNKKETSNISNISNSNKKIPKDKGNRNLIKGYIPTESKSINDNKYPLFNEETPNSERRLKSPMKTFLRNTHAKKNSSREEFQIEEEKREERINEEKKNNERYKDENN